MELVSRTLLINAIEKIVGANDKRTAFDSLNLISKIIRNIIDNPNDKKFRYLKTSNPNVSNKILNAKFSLNFFETIGYVKIPYTSDYQFVNEDLINIQIGQSLLEGYLTILGDSIEESNKAKKLEQNKEYFEMKNKLEKQLKEKSDEKARILKLIEDDKLKRLKNQK